MTTTSTRSLVRVWAALVAATCMSWALGTHHDHAGDVATSLALAIAFVKARIVGVRFMELRDAPLALRLVFDGWVIAVGAVLIGMYVLA